MMRQSRSGSNPLLQPIPVVVPFSSQQITQLQAGLLYAICVPLLEASREDTDQYDQLEQPYQNHKLTQHNAIVAAGEPYRLTKEKNDYQCHYRDGESVAYRVKLDRLNHSSAEQSTDEWQDPATLPLGLCRYFLAVAETRDLRLSHVNAEEHFEQLGIVEPVETLVCCHKFCGYKPIPGYDGPEQEPICCQKPEKDFSFELAFQQQYSAQYGGHALWRNDYILWVEVEPPSSLKG